MGSCCASICGREVSVLCSLSTGLFLGACEVAALHQVRSVYSRTQVSVYEAVRVPVSGLLLLGSLPKECVDGVRYAVLPHRLFLRIFSLLHFFRDSNGGE